MLRFYLSFLECRACRSMSLYFSYFPYISVSVHIVSILFQDLSEQDYVKGFQLLTYFLPLLLSLKMYSQSINVIMFIHILNKVSLAHSTHKASFRKVRDAAMRRTSNNSFVTYPLPRNFISLGRLILVTGEETRSKHYTETHCQNYHNFHLFFYGLVHLP